MQDENDAQPNRSLPTVHNYFRSRAVKVAEFTQLLREVSLQSSVSCFVEFVDVSHRSEFRDESLSSLLHKDRWVYYNNGLYLNIHTSREESRETHPVFGKLIDGLLRAEVWSQLGLELSVSKSSANELSIAVRHSVLSAEVKNTARRRTPHYISAVSPPIGIPITHIQSIKIHVQFSAGRPEPSLGPASTNPRDLLSDRQVLGSSVSNALENANSCIRSVKPSVSALENAYSYPQNVIKPQSRDSSFEDLSELPSPKVSCFSQSDFSSTNTVVAPHNVEHGSPPCKNHSRQNTPQSPDYRRLLESALGFCFFGPPCHGYNADIQTKRAIHGSTLAEVSPALFSPGYMEAMRQRSTFIPSIVRSLTSVLGRSSSHERFKSAKLPSKLNQELWHLAQRSLRRNDALKRTYSFSAEENESMLAHDTVSFLRVTGQPLSQLTSLQGTWNIADSVIDDENILSEENSDDGFGIGSEYVHADTLDFEMLDFDLLEAQNGRSNNDWEMLDDQADTSDSRHMLVEKQGDNMDEEEMLSD